MFSHGIVDEENFTSYVCTPHYPLERLGALENAYGMWKDLQGVTDSPTNFGVELFLRGEDTVSSVMGCL